MIVIFNCGFSVKVTFELYCRLQSQWRNLSEFWIEFTTQKIESRLKLRFSSFRYFGLGKCAVSNGKETDQRRTTQKRIHIKHVVSLGLCMTVLLHLEGLPDFRLRAINRMFLKSFINKCPVECFDAVLIPILKQVGFLFN